MSFISQESIDAVDSSAKTKTAPAAKSKAPKGYKPNPEYIETKSKRVQILMQPSLHKAAKAVSTELGLSLNDFIHRAIQEATYNEYVRGLIASDTKEG
jgi:predicted HicB family RNase H-like nuclease